VHAHQANGLILNSNSLASAALEIMR
jgi:hypothetical protein